MAEFVEVIKQRNRMTQNCKIICKSCPLEYRNNGMKVTCGELAKYPEEFERIIMDWVKENPIMTNRDKFKEVYGSDLVISNLPCPMRLSKECNRHNDCDDCMYFDFWNQEYKEPKQAE